MSIENAKAKESKRKEVRYAVSDDCRLQATILLRSSDAATASKTWPGTMVDMSSKGAHIQISLGAVAYTGDSCVLTLTHGGVKTDVRGSLAHYVCSARYSVCGVRFDFLSEGSDKAYLPYFKAIVASSTLVAGAAGTESPGRHREEFVGSPHSKLVVWRDKPAGALLGFDFTMARYAASLDTVGEDMFKNKGQVQFKSATGGDGMALSRSHELDARWEFSLAASNLPKAIAPDIRRLLRLCS
jgi:hypothetical protein